MKGREILHSVDDAGLDNQKSIALKRFYILWQCAMLLESMLHGLPHPRYTTQPLPIPTPRSIHQRAPTAIASMGDPLSYSPHSPGGVPGLVPKLESVSALTPLPSGLPTLPLVVTFPRACWTRSSGRGALLGGGT